jgi:hypothetical protein
MQPTRQEEDPEELPNAIDEPFDIKAEPVSGYRILVFGA